MPSFNLSAGSKNTWLIRTVCFFWIIAKIICWKLWLADRLFPIVPAFDFLIVPSFVHLILFIFSLTALFALIIFPGNKTIRISLLIIEIASCLLDQNRWQPWEFQYFFIILVFIINNKKEKNIFPVIGFMLATMYFYSGLSKMNPVFINEVWYKIILTDVLHVSYKTAHQFFIYHAGYLLGLIEIVLGIGLFFQRTKKIVCLLIIAMHLLILLLFGPWGINYDLVIWPWNVALMILIYLLFLKKPQTIISFQPLMADSNKFIFILFGILPMLNLFGYWQYFFSSSLFSARPPDMYICMKRTTSNTALQAFAIPHKTSLTCDSNCCMIYVRDWAFKEMATPENPEIRIYKKIKEQLIKRHPDMDAVFFTYTYVNGKRVKQELK